MIKIAISGKAGSGKDTTAKTLLKYLLADNELSYKKLAFADPIKRMILEMFPQARRSDLFGPSSRREKEIPGSTVNPKTGKLFTYRDILCDLGSLGRSYNKDIWVNKLLDTIEKIKSHTDIVIVSDLRFDNEFSHLKKNEFLTLRIKRSAHKKINDVSETTQDSISDELFDFIIDNNQDISALEKQCLTIVNKIKKV